MIASSVAVIMGSDSDWPVMKQASEILEQAGVRVESAVVSAHRTPEKMVKFAQNFTYFDKNQYISMHPLSLIKHISGHQSVVVVIL